MSANASVYPILRIILLAFKDASRINEDFSFIKQTLWNESRQSLMIDFACFQCVFLAVKCAIFRKLGKLPDSLWGCYINYQLVGLDVSLILCLFIPSCL